jgi:hypothetical protein
MYFRTYHEELPVSSIVHAVTNANRLHPSPMTGWRAFFGNSWSGPRFMVGFLLQSCAKPICKMQFFLKQQFQSPCGDHLVAKPLRPPSSVLPWCRPLFSLPK